MNSKQRRNRERFQKMVMIATADVLREAALRIQQGDLTPEEVVEDLVETADELETLFREC